jgi:hypothetical protein
MSGVLNMKSKYFTFYKITDKHEITIGLRIRNVVLNLQYYKIPKKLTYSFYKVYWPMDIDVFMMWKQIDWKKI